MLIGMFVAEWASAEFYLSTMLGRLLLAPELLSQTYTDALGAAQIQDSIRHAIEIHRNRYGARLISEIVLAEIGELNARIEKLRSLRNKFAHFCWMRSSDSEIFGTNFSGAFPNDRRLKRSSATLRVDDIRRHHAELFNAVERMKVVVSQIPRVSEDAAIAAFKTHQDGP